MLKTIIERIAAMQTQDVTSETIKALEGMRDAQTKVKRAFTDLVLNENKPLSNMSDLQKIKKNLCI